MEESAARDLSEELPCLVQPQECKLEKGRQRSAGKPGFCHEHQWAVELQGICGPDIWLLEGWGMKKLEDT